jgi:hypothetical protein
MKHVLITVIMGSAALSVAAFPANAAGLQLGNRLNSALNNCAFNNNHHPGWNRSGWSGHHSGWGGGERHDHHRFDHRHHGFGNGNGMGMNGISEFNGLGSLIDLSSLLQNAGNNGTQTGTAAAQVSTNSLSHVIASQSSYSNKDQAYINLLQLQLSGSITPQGGITWNDIFTAESIALINNEQSNQSSYESLATNSTNAEGYTIFSSGQ